MGVSVPGYTVGEEITRTARAVVYEGRAAGGRTPVILKLVQNDSCARNEVDMLRRVAGAWPEGPRHVVRLLDVHESGMDFWMVLEHFDATLDTVTPSRMTPMSAMTIALGSAKGLYETHRAGVVDDDVKPANIAFTSADGRVAHIDLDCCRLPGATPAGGTPAFAAPEVKSRHTSETSPCYGWGRTMEYILTGRMGLGPSHTLDRAVPWLGRGLAILVARCCQPDAACRPTVPQLWGQVFDLVMARRRCPRDNATMFPDGACLDALEKLQVPIHLLC